MSTRSSISVKQGDKIRSVYCHFDGYPSGVGALLLGHYNSQEKAEGIVAIGDLSSLSESIECPEGHSYGSSKLGYSVFYGRDRGESNVDALECGNFDEVLNRNSQDYNYLWNGEKWLVNGKPLTKKLIKND